MAKWLGALAALTEDLGSIPGIYVEQVETTSTSAVGDLILSPALRRCLHNVAYTQTHKWKTNLNKMTSWREIIWRGECKVKLNLGMRRETLKAEQPTLPSSCFPLCWAWERNISSKAELEEQQHSWCREWRGLMRGHIMLSMVSKFVTGFYTK